MFPSFQVLHDGAPNVGASYDKDAYQQNELALHALKCASEHLRRDGTFVTKLYRSRDYSAYLWAAQRFFHRVQAVKPSASRGQSAEIFLVCQGYLAPDKIDPRLFDPRCVFEQVDGQAAGGGDKAQTGERAAQLRIFHKDYGKRVRSRGGYDMSTLDATMRRIGCVADFLEGGHASDPIQMLSDHTGLAFFCREDPDKDARSRRYLDHPLTTAEVKTCLSDLQVLNKADFKGLLTWRDRMRAEKRRVAAAASEGAAAGGGDSAVTAPAAPGSDDDDERVQEEIAALRHKKTRELKRKKKKERELAAKRRKRAAFGMDLNAIEVPDHNEIFSLATITNASDLELVRDVDLEKVTMAQVGGGADDTSEDEEGLATNGGEGGIWGDEEDENNYSLEAELNAAYDRYLTNTKDGMAKSGTKMAKRTKKLRQQKALDEAREDAGIAGDGDADVSGDAKAYAELLEGGRSDGDDDSDSDDDDEETGDIVRDGSDKVAKAKLDDNVSSEDEAPKALDMTDPSQNVIEEEKPTNPLIFNLAADSASVKTNRWFSNPLFQNIENTARTASFCAKQHSVSDDDNVTDDDDIVQHLDEDDDERPSKKRKKKRQKVQGNDTDEDSAPIDAQSIIDSMPKTDKQKRHEKRLKSIERMKRRNARKEREAGLEEPEFRVAPVSDDGADDAMKAGNNMSEATKQKRLEARALIKAGMGNAGQVGGRDEKDSGFEVVASSQGPLPVLDSRKYDSENEDYDSDDHARTLALGTMILRKSKEKALVDASYNRYAWNDPKDLPDWFVDDENRHYRPQLPIPPELVEKMKAKYLHLATKPIAKVAEARARKSKMARVKLAAAKKKAEAVSNSNEMSEAMKLRAISKAMRGKEAAKPGKTYVVSRKGGNNRGGKGVKLVDKRERNDKRAMERKAGKKKHGKKGGMTGSKRRRHHK